MVTNPDTGQAARLKDDGSWEIMSSPLTLSGSGKAIGSGLAHEGIPSLLGAGGDMRDLVSKGGAAAINWMKGNKEGEEGYVTPEKIKETAGSLPGPLGFVSRNAPTSEKVKEKVSNVVGPEYVPQNYTEKGLKTTAGFVPAALGALETGGAPLWANLLRTVGRYAAAPGIASEGVRAGFDKFAPGYKGGLAEEGSALLATLLSPMAATKLITPNPADAIQRAAGQTLTERGSTFTPKQLTQGDIEKESKQLGVFGTNTPVLKENAKNVDNYNRGTLRTAFEDTLPAGPVREEALAATKITPELRERVTRTIDNEFNRLTDTHTMPISATLQRDLDRVVKNYEREAVIRKNPQLAADVQEIKNLGSTVNRPGLPAGHITGRQYQNLRSRLSQLAADEGDATLSRSLRSARDAVDNSMDRVINTYAPHDAGAFQRARDAYQNNMIVNRAMNQTGANAAKYNLTPQDLAQSARGVLGHEAFGMETHPLARFARAGENVLTPLPPAPSIGLAHGAHLAATLGGGAALEQAGTGSLHGLGYGLGLGAAMAPYASRPVVKALLENKVPGGRAYLMNQLIPSEERRQLLRDPGAAGLMATALSKLGRKKSGEE